MTSGTFFLTHLTTKMVSYTNLTNISSTNVMLAELLDYYIIEYQFQINLGPKNPEVTAH